MESVRNSLVSFITPLFIPSHWPNYYHIYQASKISTGGARNHHSELLCFKVCHHTSWKETFRSMFMFCLKTRPCTQIKQSRSCEINFKTLRNRSSLYHWVPLHRLIFIGSLSSPILFPSKILKSTLDDDYKLVGFFSASSIESRKYDYQLHVVRFTQKSNNRPTASWAMRVHFCTISLRSSSYINGVNQLRCRLKLNHFWPFVVCGGNVKRIMLRFSQRISCSDVVREFIKVPHR